MQVRKRPTNRVGRGVSIFDSRFVAHSLRTTAGRLVIGRLTEAENPSRQSVSYFGYTTLGCPEDENAQRRQSEEGGPALSMN